MIEPTFEVEYLGEKLSVVTKQIDDRYLFKISFPSGTQPLVISRANNAQENKFWTSIPEGRLEEAKQIGPLIEQYYRAKQSA